MQHWDHDAALMLLALAILAATGGCAQIVQQFSHRKVLEKIFWAQIGAIKTPRRIPLPCFCKPSFRRPYHAIASLRIETQAQLVLRLESAYANGEPRHGFTAWFNDARDTLVAERELFDQQRDTLLAYGFAVRRTPYDYAETTTVVAVTTAKAA